MVGLPGLGRISYNHPTRPYISCDPLSTAVPRTRPGAELKLPIFSRMRWTAPPAGVGIPIAQWQHANTDAEGIHANVESTHDVGLPQRCHRRCAAAGHRGIPGHAWTSLDARAGPAPVGPRPRILPRADRSAGRRKVSVQDARWRVQPEPRRFATVTTHPADWPSPHL